MKLIFYEINKVLCKKTFIVILALCLLLNLGIFYYTQTAGVNNQYIFSEYPQMAKTYSEMPIDKAEYELKNESKAYEILSLMNSVSNIQSDEELDMTLEEIAGYKETEPQAYAIAEKLSNSTEYDGNREMFVNELLYQIEYINGYPSFINEMFDRAEAQSSFSIFSSKNDFSYKNLFKTAEDYKHLSDVKLTVGNDIPVTAATEYSISDFFLVSLVFLICIYMFVSEREKGLYNLVRSSEHGRCRTIIAKFCALFVLSAVITIIFSLCNYAMSAYMYGEFDFFRMIQSVSKFRNCVFSLNIGEFCILNILGKAAVMIVISAIFALIFTAILNPSFMYLICVGLIVIEYIFKNFLPDITSLNYFKYINIFYMLDGKSFWGEYVNINIFSNPVTVYILDIVVFLLVFLICVLSAVIIFTRKYQNKKAGRAALIAEKIKLKYFRCKGNTSVLSGEMYKLLVLNKMILLIIVVVAVGVYSSLQTINYPYVDKSSPYYQEYMEYLQGEITPEKENFIKEEQKYFDNLNLRISEISNNDSLSEKAKGVVINTIENIFETKGAAFNQVLEQYNRLVILRENGVDARFIDENLYSDFIFNEKREWSNFVILLLTLLVSVPFIISIDYKNGIINILRATKNGKNLLINDKFITALSILIILFAAIYLPYLISFINSFGTNSFSTPIVCLGMYQSISSHIRIIEAFFVSTGCYFAVAFFAVSFILVITSIIKNHMLSVIISTIFLIIPCLIIYPCSTIRAGAIFSENCVLYSSAIILLSIIFALLCLILTFVKFTNTKLGGKRYART